MANREKTDNIPDETKISVEIDHEILPETMNDVEEQLGVDATSPENVMSNQNPVEQVRDEEENLASMGSTEDPEGVITDADAIDNQAHTVETTDLTSDDNATSDAQTDVDNGNITDDDKLVKSADNDVPEEQELLQNKNENTTNVPIDDDDVQQAPDGIPVNENEENLSADNETTTNPLSEDNTVSDPAVEEEKQIDMADVDQHIEFPDDNNEQLTNVVTDPIPNGEKSYANSVIENDENMGNSETSDKVAAKDELEKGSHRADELDLSITGSQSINQLVPNNKSIAKVSIDEEKPSLMHNNDLTLADVLLNSELTNLSTDPNNLQQMMANDRKPVAAVSTTQNMKPIDDSVIVEERLVNDDDDWAFKPNKVTNVSPKEQSSEPIVDNGFIEELPVNTEVTTNSATDVEETMNAIRRSSHARVLSGTKADNRAPLGASAGPLNALDLNSNTGLIGVNERQGSNVSSGSEQQGLKTSRRNTAHTIVDLSKVADISTDYQKPTDAMMNKESITALGTNNGSAAFFTASRSADKPLVGEEQVGRSMIFQRGATSSAASDGNFESFMSSENAENSIINGDKADESARFLNQGNRSGSDRDSLNVTNGSGSSGTITAENETIGALNRYSRRSSLKTTGRKAHRLSFIDNAHVIQINSSKESHMRALPSEKFWRRNQRRVSAVPTPEEGETAQT